MDERGSREISRFREVLSLAVGHDRWPEFLAGDLSDLLGTLEQGAELLRVLMTSSSREEIPARFLAVKLLVADDLRLLAEDLLPALDQVTTEAYAELGKD